MKALLLENIHPSGIKLLTEKGYDVETLPSALGEDDLIAALQGVDLLGIRSNTMLTKRVFESAPQLKAVGAFCIGTNQIALDEATARGVAVFNAPYSNTRSVVELAIGEIIAMARHLTDHNARMHAGEWVKSAKGSHEIRGRSLGIVGYGNIGSQLSVVAESLGMSVYFYDIVDRLALGNARRMGSLEELLATAETISLHVDGRAENEQPHDDPVRAAQKTPSAGGEPQQACHAPPGRVSCDRVLRSVVVFSRNDGAHPRTLYCVRGFSFVLHRRPPITGQPAAPAPPQPPLVQARRLHCFSRTVYHSHGS